MHPEKNVFAATGQGATDVMTRRILRHTALLLCLSLVFVSMSLQAARTARSPGIYIPPLKTSQADELTATRWDVTATGGHMQVNAPADEAWAALEQTLAGFGIKPLQRDVAVRAWLTDWVVWKYDSKTGTGQSKPGFSFTGKNLERHRFRFTVKTGDAADTAIIMATDHTRQEQVDIAPDSTYAWLEWQARDVQQAAADTFLRRLQIALESALATRFVVREELTSDADGGTVIIESEAETDADVVLITLPQGGEQPLQAMEPVVIPDQPSVAVTVVAPPAESAATPKESPPVVKETDTMASTEPQSRPTPVASKPAGDTPAPAIAPEPPATESPSSTPADRRSLTAAKPASEIPAPAPPAAETPPSTAAAVKPTTAPEPSAAETPSSTAAAVKPSAPVRPAANGLLVKAAPDVAWQALQRSLQDLEIGRASGDDRQYLLTTDWIEGDYDRKNRVLVMRLKDEPLWAFSLSGNRGLERHRFQLVIVPANQGTQSIIYAYHTGSQEQIDQTPDSSQTLLSWVDRETSPEVALAFLRKLRIIIPQ